MHGLGHMLAEGLVAQPEFVVGMGDECRLHQHRRHLVVAEDHKVRGLNAPAGNPQNHTEFILDHLCQHEALRGQVKRLRAVDGRARRGIGMNTHVECGAALAGQARPVLQIHGRVAVAKQQHADPVAGEEIAHAHRDVEYHVGLAQSTRPDRAWILAAVSWIDRHQVPAGGHIRVQVNGQLARRPVDDIVEFSFQGDHDAGDRRPGGKLRRADRHDRCPLHADLALDGNEHGILHVDSETVGERKLPNLVLHRAGAVHGNAARLAIGLETDGRHLHRASGGERGGVRPVPGGLPWRSASRPHLERNEITGRRGGDADLHGLVQIEDHPRDERLDLELRGADAVHAGFADRVLPSLRAQGGIDEVYDQPVGIAEHVRLDLHGAGGVHGDLQGAGGDLRGDPRDLGVDKHGALGLVESGPRPQQGERRLHRDEHLGPEQRRSHRQRLGLAVDKRGRFVQPENDRGPHAIGDHDGAIGLVVRGNGPHGLKEPGHGSHDLPIEDNGRHGEGNVDAVDDNPDFRGLAGGRARQHPGRGHRHESGRDEFHALPQRTSTTCRSRGVPSLYHLSRTHPVPRENPLLLRARPPAAGVCEWVPISCMMRQTRSQISYRRRCAHRGRDGNSVRRRR